MKLRWHTVLILGVVLVVYTVIGGVIFSALESNHEEQMRDDLLQQIRDFIGDSPCINMSSLGEAHAIMTDMKENGLDVTADGSIIRQTLWDLRSSMFVSLQIIATIGFPSAAPRSGGGRAFTVAFAILGIPLFLVTAIGLGQLLNRLAEWLRLLLLRTCCRDENFCCGARVFRTLVIAVLGIILFIIIPSLIFKSIEPWSYSDSFYFAFITMSTIGFGDLTPSYNDVPWMSENYKNWYRLAIAFWILLLSAWLAAVIVAIQTNITTKALDSLDDLQDRALRRGARRGERREEDWEHDIQSNMRFGLRNDMKAGPQQSSYNQFYKQQQWHDDQLIYQPVGGSPALPQPQWRQARHQGRLLWGPRHTVRSQESMCSRD